MNLDAATSAAAEAVGGCEEASVALFARDLKFVINIFCQPSYKICGFMWLLPPVIFKTICRYSKLRIERLVQRYFSWFCLKAVL